MGKTAIAPARAGYFQDTATRVATRSVKSIEYDIIAKTTFRLAEAARRPKSRFADLAAALHANRQLWTALAADVFSDGNGLAPDLKANIVYLSEFVSKQSGEVLLGKAQVRPLIEINLAILKGLKASEAAK